MNSKNIELCLNAASGHNSQRNFFVVVVDIAVIDAINLYK